MEELFRKLPGVMTTEVGYTGGTNDHPTDQKHPGHAEALLIRYDPKQISYRALLDFFFRVHDPTTLNRQGNDMGTSYRSAIFYANEAEHKEAQAFIERVNKSGRWAHPVVTSLEPFIKFWLADSSHQDYLQKNPDGYTCHFSRFDSYFT